ncbi:MAG: DUF2341 domain-containing protein, partial [Planctomycetota bacterium]
VTLNPPAGGGGPFGNGYSYRRLLTIPAAQVSGTSALSDFALLFSGTFPYLKTTANGGLVQSASGYDIRFESTAGVKLDHEVERWDGVSGDFTAWVRIPALNGDSDTTLYLYYGNGAVGGSGADASMGPRLVSRGNMLGISL